MSMATKLTYDALVIGGGVAGLTLALRLADKALYCAKAEGRNCVATIRGTETQLFLQKEAG